MECTANMMCRQTRYAWFGYARIKACIYYADSCHLPYQSTNNYDWVKWATNCMSWISHIDVELYDLIIFTGELELGMNEVFVQSRRFTRSKQNLVDFRAYQELTLCWIHHKHSFRNAFRFLLRIPLRWSTQISLLKGAKIRHFYFLSSQKEKRAQKNVQIDSFFCARQQFCRFLLIFGKYGPYFCSTCHMSEIFGIIRKPPHFRARR